MAPHPFDASRTFGNPLQDAIDYAFDLAYGALHGYWDPVITTFRGGLNFLNEEHPYHAAFLKKWQQEGFTAPPIDLLVSLGYLDHIPLQQQNAMAAFWRISRQAFDLLARPYLPTRIFISYRRRESSAFALLLEARLRIAGVPPEGIFVDKDISLGELWEQRIHRELSQTDYFVCLIGPTTLTEGSWVMREIEVLKAVKPATLIVPVCHNGTRLGSLPEPLASSNGYELGKPSHEETALDYEMAISYVLNALGYRTY